MGPFPSFPGAFFTLGVEVDIGRAAPPEIGCVIVQPDGRLYELKMGVDLDNIDSNDPVAMRSEEATPLEDLPPLTALTYLRAALDALGALPRP
ncbi:MAG: hypothetical protein GEU28_08150 [Dehalococcoidia bacterium]|nr:hypothetical protein [Dehalococcoidia bacterium]